MVKESPGSATVRGPNPFLTISKYLLIALVATGLGMVLGYQLTSPNAGLTISVLVILTALMVILQRPIYGMVIWLLLDPFIETWVKLPMGSGIPDLSFSRFMIAFLAVVLLAQGAIGKFRFVPLSLVDICIVLVPLGIAVAAPLSVNPVWTAQVALSIHFTTLILYFFAKNLVRTRANLHLLFWTILLGGLVAALYGIYELATGNIMFLAQDAMLEHRLAGYTSTLRLVRGFIGSANIARVLTASIPIGFYLFFESKSLPRKIFIVAILAIQAYGIFLTYNRTAWYGLLISLFIIQFFYPQFRKAFVIIVIVAAVVLFVTWDQVNESDIVQDRIGSKESTLDDRSTRWEAGYNMWQARPIRGWGFGRYEQRSGEFRTDGLRTNFVAIENDFLYILVGTGLIGFAPYFLFLVLPFISSIRLFFKASAPGWSGFIKKETITIYWAVMISFVIGSYTQIHTQAIVKMIPFAVAGAIVGSHEYLLRRDRRR